MRIDAVELHHLEIPFKSAFQHATKARSRSETVIVALRSEGGEVGFGEILPRPYLTGETISSVLERDGPALADTWLGLSLESLEDVVAHDRRELDRSARRLAAYAGFEVALVDLAGRELGFPAGDVLGLPPGRDLEPGVVVGFEVPTAKLERHCAALRMAGRRHVKLKVGQPDDRRRAEIVIRVLSPPGGLRLDANGIWSSDEAVRALGDLVDLGIASVEQPVAARDLEGMRRVRETTGVAVMADESLCSLEDGRRLVEARAADVFNVRLGKCGGFLGSLRLVELAQANGLSCHLGTLVGETGILSRASEVFGSRVPGFDCLEGKGQNRFLLQQDVLGEPEVQQPGSGLGIQVSADRLAGFAVAPPAVFRRSKGARS